MPRSPCFGGWCVVVVRQTYFTFFVPGRLAQLVRAPRYKGVGVRVLTAHPEQTQKPLHRRGFYAPLA